MAANALRRCRHIVLGSPGLIGYRPFMMSSDVIKRAGPDEVDAIRNLVARAYARWVGVTPRKPKPMTADYDAAIGVHRFDLLYRSGELAGLIETVIANGELMIVNVAIDPRHQGKGLGSSLMRHAEQLARASDLRGTRLYTNKLMTENIELYERLGYRFEKETQHEGGMVAVHMVLPLGN